ncbi:hypothetical protein GCM10020254_28290 [Streptomyces goshikiensis]
MERFVAVRRDTSASGAVKAIPTRVPVTMAVTEGHRPSPKDGGSQPKTMTPRQRLEPRRIETRSRGPLVRSFSGMVSTPRCSMGMGGLPWPGGGWPSGGCAMFERHSM